MRVRLFFVVFFLGVPREVCLIALVWFGLVWFGLV